MISACFQQVPRTSYSMLSLTISLSPVSLHQVWPTNISAVSAVTLGAGWGASEDPVYPTSSYRGPKQSLRPLPCPGSHLHFFRKWLAFFIRRIRNWDISLSVGTRDNPRTRETLWKRWLRPASWQQSEEHRLHGNNGPQRSNKKNQEEKLLAETELLPHKN